MDAGGGRGGAGAQEWEGGGLDALRGAGGWGRGLEGEAPEATGGYPLSFKDKIKNRQCVMFLFRLQITNCRI